MKQSVRQQIDMRFALQWCKKSIIILFNADNNQATRNRHLTASIGNYTYTATVSDFIKERVYIHSFEWQFIENPDHRIQTVLARSEIAS